MPPEMVVQRDQVGALASPLGVLKFAPAMSTSQAGTGVTGDGNDAIVQRTLDSLQIGIASRQASIQDARASLPGRDGPASGGLRTRV